MDGVAVARELALTLERALGARCRGIALFGSWARGDARADSDVDLLLVAEALATDPFARAAELGRPLAARLEPVNLLARTPDEFEADVTPLHLDLALDAKVLYERDRYLSDKLALVRRRIEEAGLWRDSGLFWRWHRVPTVTNWAIHWDGVRV
jgi:predicted nucleotidyltransferase